MYYEWYKFHAVLLQIHRYAIFIPCYASTDKKIVMFVPEVGNGSVSKTTYWYFYNLKFESLTHNEKTSTRVEVNIIKAYSSKKRENLWNVEYV